MFVFHFVFDLRNADRLIEEIVLILFRFWIPTRLEAEMLEKKISSIFDEIRIIGCSNQNKTKFTANLCFAFILLFKDVFERRFKNIYVEKIDFFLLNEINDSLE